jgi:hypothetical protein
VIATTALLLLAGHAFGDFGLQNDYVSSAKSAFGKHAEWPWVLAGHALIHGGIVALVTGVWWLGLLEALAHAVIDHNKCAGRLSYSADQLLHLGCKGCWLAALGLAK